MEPLSEENTERILCIKQEPEFVHTGTEEITIVKEEPIEADYFFDESMEVDPELVKVEDLLEIKKELNVKIKQESLPQKKGAFLSKLSLITKCDNSGLISCEKYNTLLTEVENAKEKQKAKQKLVAKDYRRLSRYDILCIGDTKKLIVPTSKTKGDIKYFVKTEELFDVIHKAHAECGHGGRVRMEENLKRKFHNIPRDIIMMYLSLCESCQKKKSNPKRGVVIKPILSNNLNSRAQVDLIDMQSSADGDFKFILVYQDHLTKYVFLRALKTKRAAEVACALIDLFCFLGAPNILQSDNGREFANEIIHELSEMWPGLKMVHGKSSHSQSQGSMERTNQDVEHILRTWMEETQNKQWSKGLRFCQFRKNNTFHGGIGQTPYEALFGRKAQLGLTSSQLPSNLLDTLSSEEDLKKLLDSRTHNIPSTSHSM